MKHCQEILIFVLFYYTVKAFNRNVRLLPKCRPIPKDWCSKFYNQTSYDGSLSDSTFQMGMYMPLLKTECHMHLRLFLCSTFFPMCTVLDKPLLPCRSLCLEVKSKCERFIMQYTDYKWPYHMRCDKYPVKSNSDLCIERSKEKTELVHHNKVYPNKRTKIKENEKIILMCPSLKKIHFKKIIHEKPNCIRLRSQELLRKFCNNQQICEFELKDVARSYGQPTTCFEGNIGPSGIKYQCNEDKQVKSMVLNYGEDANLFCKSSSRYLVILKVEFKDETCVSPNPFCSVMQACSGKTRCVLWANKYYLQSSCDNNNIKLTVHYECQKRIPGRVITVEGYLKEEKDPIELKCPKQHSIINIIRAEYVSEYCHTKQIHCAVNLQCHRKRTCRLSEKTLSAVLCKEARSKVSISYTCS